MRPFHWPRTFLGASLLGAILVAAWFAFARRDREAEREGSAGATGPAPAAHEASAAKAGAGTTGDPSAPDCFHPERDEVPAPAPRKGGRLVVHVEAQPFNLNGLLTNSSVTRRILDEIHASLVDLDVHTSELVPSLAESWSVEDTLVLRDGTRLWGRLEDLGASWRVSAGSGAPHPLADAPRDVRKDDVERVERSTVFTFTLREGVRWHDGHPLRVEDFLLPWRLTRIPEVDCGTERFLFAPITAAEKLDERRLRFVYERQYYGSLGAFEELIPLPSHRYDLRDPENPERRPEASDAELARYVNEHPLNRRWIGLGPYRLEEVTDEYVEARRFEGYFDPEHGGYLDAIRWRYVQDDAAAFRALVDGELDFTAGVLAEDYFGPVAASRDFTERFYLGHYYTPRMSFVSWNLRRPLFQDVRVRTALAHAFDWDELIASFYGGLAQRVTAEWYDGDESYDRSVAPIPFDLARAAKLLAESGWYDRDGDGRIDKDGRPFEFEFLMQRRKSTEAMAQRFQENLARIGVRMHIVTLEWAAQVARVDARDFDAEYRAWVMPIGADPEQRWHSSEVGPGTGNYTSFADADVDRLIEAFQRELDPRERAAISRELHRRLYAAQAYLYGVKVPVKFALSRRIRGFRISPHDPGYRLREWYYAE